MTIVYNQVIVEVNGVKSRQLSGLEIAGIAKEIERMFGVPNDNPQAIQGYLDRYCQQKGRKPLIVTDIIL